MPDPFFHGALIRLSSVQEDYSLPFAVNHLTKFDVIAVFIFFVLRKASNAISSLFGKVSSYGDHSAGSPESTRIRLPKLSLRAPLHVREIDTLNYCKAATTNMRSHGHRSDARPEDQAVRLVHLQPHLALFLSAITEPAMLLLLASATCPIDPVGAVNVRNTFEIYDALLCRGLISPDHKQGHRQYSTVATLPPEARQVKRGVEIDIAVSILYDLGEAKAPVEIYRQTFTVLEFVKSARHGASMKNAPGVNDFSGPVSGVKFCMSAIDPFLWAALCKDYNPIHLYASTARLLGFKGQIAHGNHVIARALELLPKPDGNPAVPDVVSGDHNVPFRLEVEFKRPIPILRECVVVPQLDDGSRIRGLHVATSGSARPSIVATFRYHDDHDFEAHRFV